MKRKIVVVGAVAVLCVAGPLAAQDGKAIYDNSCGGCHNNIPPKLGDKEKWAPLIKQGTGALVASTIKGKGAMPPKGGAASLSDADIKAAVEYMISRSK